MAHILLIEDSSDYADIVAFYLKSSGFTVTAVRDGREGLDKARAGGVDLSVTDLMLPSLNGYEICALLKQDSRHQRIPIMILTASTLQAKDRELALQCGANAFCAKSTEPKQLLERVQALLSASTSASSP
jgi:DNA-binding response OmpR family regulator